MAELSAAPHHDDLSSFSKASCSASTSYVHYDVFISHCGRDADAGTFATDLHNRLISRDLHVFLDKLVYEEEEVTSQMEAAISVASVQIAIFSRNYAEWKWCLDALVHMKKSEGTIVPVFYKVKPSEVRWTGKCKDGPYAQWLLDHEEKERYDSQAIQNWRDVMFSVSEIIGFELEACNGGEEELLDKVAESVFKVCPHPHYEVFINHRGPDTKKKFARPLYERLESCGLRVFLDQPELVEGLEITSQIELAIGVARVHIAIFSPTYAQSTWCLDELNLMTMSGATVLPVFYEVEPSVLDGVYAEALVDHEKSGRYKSETIRKWRGALSKVAKINDFVLDENKGNLLDEIVQRVMKHFPDSQVVQSSEEQSVVKCVLMENDDPKSCNAIRSSQVVQSDRSSQVVQSKLKHYFGLEEKLELSGLERWTSLEELDVRVCSRLESIYGLGQLTKLRTLILDELPEIEELPGLKDLICLETLQIWECRKLRSIENFGLLTKLRTLNLVELHEIKELPGLEYLTSLEKLDVERCLRLESIYGLGQLTKLRRLSLVELREIEELPGLKDLTCLENLRISKCEKLRSIENLGQHTKLRRLSLEELREIEELPGLKDLTCLEKLRIWKCEKLRSIENLGQQTKLPTLSLVELPEIEALPGLEHLTSLEMLKVKRCWRLESIYRLGQLTKLRTLSLVELPEIEELPGLKDLTCLEKLEIWKCEKLRSIENLGQHTKLLTLSLVELPEIEELPGLEHLTSLETLYVRGCKKLQSLQGLAQLSKLR